QQITSLSAENLAFNNGLIAESRKAAEKMKASAVRAIWSMVIVGLAAVGLGVAVSLWMTSAKIAAPLNRLSQRMGRLAGGDLEVEIEGAARRDEVGAMARAVQIFKDNGLKSRALAADAERLRTENDAERDRSEAERRAVATEQEMVVVTLAEALDRLA